MIYNINNILQAQHTVTEVLNYLYQGEKHYLINNGKKRAKQKHNYTKKPLRLLLSFFHEKYNPMILQK